ncbi:class I SAM-dependent methyltransferase [Cellulomonas fimi]|uniref:class I SAM-dependent methyltransferase n=1 Tax=Cellulomonas fimi TaxID=1708 RepID=UPI00234CD948|nr:class I SAM-dependent methyltransferase [Cellulomonas fimi]MDC7121646.1 class I SAM-dependent methyltransferase [Cellulomonas fimi]
MRDRTDAAWEAYGRDDPYFGVLSDPRFHRGSLTADAMDDFFASGDRHVATVLKSVNELSGGQPSTGRALDFGCGVGRVLIPLAEHYERVTGVDVSASMLTEAAENCARAGVRNVDFVLSDGEGLPFDDSYDLVHSTMVLQHIRTRRGLQIIDGLLARLAGGGVAVLQFPLPVPSARRLEQFARAWVPPLNGVANLARRRPWSTPLMEMHGYSLDRLVALLHGRGIDKSMLERVRHGDFPGVILVCRRPRRAGVEASGS